MIFLKGGARGTGGFVICFLFIYLTYTACFKILLSWLNIASFLYIYILNIFLFILSRENTGVCLIQKYVWEEDYLQLLDKR